jgi:hypothetical protein
MEVVSVFCRQITTFPSNIFVEEAVYSPLYAFGTLSKLRWA